MTSRSRPPVLRVVRVEPLAQPPGSDPVMNALLRSLDPARDGAYVARGVAEKIAELRTRFFCFNPARGEEKREAMRSAHAAPRFGS